MLLHNISIMTPHRQMRRLFLCFYFNTPCDSSRIRANRTWLIAKNTAAFLRCMLLHNITKMLSIMTPHRQMRRLFLKNKKLIISVALQIRENALWLYRRVLESVCWANRVLPETCIAFFFPLRGVCVVFLRYGLSGFIARSNIPCIFAIAVP